MDRINEHNLEPGTYQHYKGGIYVVIAMVTHMDNPTTGKMELAQDPLVVYRDIDQIMRHINGKATLGFNTYARKLSEFMATVMHNNETVKRFKKI